MNTDAMIASSTAAKPVAFLLADLGVTKSHSRPRTSNDNPYSEAHFKTLKYRPDFPDRFDTIGQARAFCRAFFTWYNTAHRHSGIAWHTPHDVHHGHTDTVNAVRAEVLTAAYQRNPERFVRKHPEPAALPTAAWINQPDQDQDQDQRIHSKNP
jgi:putative transposase